MRFWRTRSAITVITLNALRFVPGCVREHSITSVPSMFSKVKLLTSITFLNSVMIIRPWKNNWKNIVAGNAVIVFRKSISASSARRSPLSLLVVRKERRATWFWIKMPSTMTTSLTMMIMNLRKNRLWTQFTSAKTVPTSITRSASTSPNSSNSKIRLDSDVPYITARSAKTLETLFSVLSALSVITTSAWIRIRSRNWPRSTSFVMITTTQWTCRT